MRATLSLLELVGGIRRHPDDLAVSDFEILDLSRRGDFDADLLFRRMAMLHIDRDAVAADDPLLSRELQGLCTLCKGKPMCRRDLSREPDDPAWQDWRDYCPNATTLSLLATLQEVGRASEKSAAH